MAAEQTVAHLRGHPATVYRVAFSADSKTVATARWDGPVRLWHVPTGAELFTIRRPIGVVGTVAFLPDGRHMAVGAGTWVSKDLTLWDTYPPRER